MPLKRLIGILLIAGLAASGCSGPKPPEPVELGPAAVISIDSVTTEPGTVQVPIRMTYLPGGKERMDTLDAFRFLVSFDTTVLRFTGKLATTQATTGWFMIPFRGTLRKLCEDCSLRGVPVGALRGRSRVDTTDPQAYPEGIIATVEFEVVRDQALSGVSTELSFGSYSCSDNTLMSRADATRYYIADPAYGPVSAGAAVDTTACPAQYDFEPILAFESGAVTVADFVSAPPTAIITVGSATATAWSDFYLPITLSYPDDVTQDPLRVDRFELLLDYDAAGLTLIGVEQGDDVSLWEYFRWWSGPAYCSDCSSEAIRIVGLYDLYNAITPTPLQNHPKGTIAKLHFSARGGAEAGDTTHNIWFVSEDCRDNALTDSHDYVLYVPNPYDPHNDERVLGPETCMHDSRYRLEHGLRFGSGTVTVAGSEDGPPIRVIVALDTVHTSSGAEFSVPIRISYPDPATLDSLSFDGFDFTITYDSTAMRFLDTVEQGPAISVWENFGWIESSGSELYGWPSNTVRIIALRRMGEGDQTESLPDGLVATIRFQAREDTRLPGGSYDVGFITRYCSENILFDQEKRITYLAHSDYTEGEQRVIHDPPCGNSWDPLFEQALGFHSARVFIDDEL